MFSLLPLLNCVGCQVTLKKVSEQLLKEGEAVSRLQAELKKEQGVVKSLKSKLTKVRICWLQSDNCNHNKDMGISHVCKQTAVFGSASSSWMC
jgi:hypothetical protein